MILLELFKSFFIIGILSFGGGMAAMPLIFNETVTKHAWLTAQEFTHLVTIAEMTPGPIALNSATFVGTQISGISGALVATAGCILPSIIVVSIFALLVKKFGKTSFMEGVLKGLRVAVVALIVTAFLTIAKLAFFKDSTVSLEMINYVSVGLFASGLFAFKKFKLHPIIIMVACGIIGGGIYYFLL